ncbi:MAG: RES family NAD+ phosphorylase [Treponema sp.]|nr:RES family NAD+ phosphorylase [Treponema sp.]
MKVYRIAQKDWRTYSAMPELQDFVEDWVEKGGFVLKVPSAIVPEESNYLINPKSALMNTVRIANSEDFSLDERLLKR